MGYSVKGKQGFQAKHGLSNHPLYGTWKRMKNRCYNVRSKDFKDYGGRGITVCESWRSEFLSFYQWAINNGWEKGLSIERIDYNGGYSPDNCTWIPMRDQSKNRRSVKMIEYNGESHSVSEWSRITGIARKTLQLRLNSKNFTLKDAFEKPVNKALARR